MHTSGGRQQCQVLRVKREAVSEQRLRPFTVAQLRFQRRGQRQEVRVVGIRAQACAQNAQRRLFSALRLGGLGTAVDFHLLTGDPAPWCATSAVCCRDCGMFGGCPCAGRGAVANVRHDAKAMRWVAARGYEGTPPHLHTHRGVVRPGGPSARLWDRRLATTMCANPGCNGLHDAWSSLRKARSDVTGTARRRLSPASFHLSTNSKLAKSEYPTCALLGVQTSRSSSPPSGVDMRADSTPHESHGTVTTEYMRSRRHACATSRRDNEPRRCTPQTAFKIT
eukprot:351491-Chlamydomonas_euryale.AAC.13